MSAALDLRGLTVTFPGPRGPIRAVRGVSLTVAPGEVVGLVGESGSGKSVTMLAASRLLDERRCRLEAERLEVGGRTIDRLSRRALEDLRGPVVSYVFQDPLTALNPLMPVGRQIAESLRRHRGLGREEAAARAVALLRQVGIAAPELRARQLPYQLSGGMRQRAMIAIALAPEPQVLIADEPTTALDVTVQAEIVRLLQSLQRERGMAMVWVTHDLALLARLADRVVVMYAGRIVEDAPAGRLYAAPAHPYTAGLLASTSRFDVPLAEQRPIPGAPPGAGEDPPGCAFAPRCAFAVEACRAARPPLAATADGRLVACIRPLVGDGA